ncbi:MAG: hypothetical protein HZA04_06345 [Nitrospinae bacterium]|nr:hypothetical protein [Nitrospinota bacterium]
MSGNFTNYAAMAALYITVPCASPAMASSLEDIQSELSQNIVAAVEGAIQSPLSEKDRAYALFLIAVHGHNADAREQSEELFSKMKSPESAAYLGSLKTIHARDFGGGGFLQTLSNVTPLGWIRLGYVSSGTELLGNAVKDRPENIEIRLLRANTYFNLPAPFGKFDEGYADINTVIEWLKNGKADLPAAEPLFRDRASAYFTAGLFHAGKGEKEAAREMFRATIALAASSPYTEAAQKALAAMER